MRKILIFNDKNYLPFSVDCVNISVKNKILNNVINFISAGDRDLVQ